MRLGDDQRASGINRLMQTNIKQMNFESELPEFINTQSSKNQKFKKDLIKHTLKKVYNCDTVYEIEYSKRLKELMKGIGEWRSDSGHSAGIKFTNPET